MKCPHWIIATVVLGMTVITAQAQAKVGKLTTRRWTYCGDLPLQKPVLLRASVMDVLLARTEVQENLEPSDQDNPQRARRLFRAAEIALGGPDEVDLIVIGRYPLSGADNNWFWIVRSANEKPKVVLFTQANCLKLGSLKSNGLLDIRALWASASKAHEVLYRFNGLEYVPSKNSDTKKR